MFGLVLSPQGLVSPALSGKWIAGMRVTLYLSLSLLEKPQKVPRVPSSYSAKALLGNCNVCIRYKMMFFWPLVSLPKI